MGVYAAAETCKTVSFYISPFKKSIKKISQALEEEGKILESDGIFWLHIGSQHSLLKD